MEIKKKFQDGFLYFHGKRDTYNLATANLFDWETKGKSTGDDHGQIKCDYKNIYAFWRGLVTFRKSATGKIFRLKDKPAEGYYKWIEPDNSKLLGYMVDKRVLVIINTDTVQGEFKKIKLPPGRDWKLIAIADRIEPEHGIKNDKYSRLKANQEYHFLLEPASLMIWVREE